MISVTDIRQAHFESISVDSFWSAGDERELKMHRIHAYPAKFPAFITTKALDFAKHHGIGTECIADIFCGCGTVAFEAKRNSINFWGCDISPVATMIAKTKSRKYTSTKLTTYYAKILDAYDELEESDGYSTANDRIKYWYSQTQFEKLARLKKAIEGTVPLESSYRLFFTCAFSNILKTTSRWLTKSIKPQIDPNKKPIEPLDAFRLQYDFMVSANEEIDFTGSSRITIVTANLLSPFLRPPKVDMIISSPPYVTSYEYADLHQLSSLWLGYTNNYRDLRVGSIGSLYHTYNFDRELKRLNDTGTSVVFRLFVKDKSIARSVAKYFLDMQGVVKVCQNMLSDDGMVLFIIGNTEYKGVRIDNVRHLSESLLNNGFHNVLVTKRKVTGKILTPYRDELGRFTTDDNSRKVYGEEFIVIGRKK
ncbi:MAG: class I SAM-dependent methyltransferase [Syntrophobacteraceae bacterium]